MAVKLHCPCIQSAMWYDSPVSGGRGRMRTEVSKRDSSFCAQGVARDALFS